MSSPDPQMRKEIDAIIHAEIRRRDRRNARFWFGALIVGIIAVAVVLLFENSPMMKALLALIAFVGIFGFFAFLSTKPKFGSHLRLPRSAGKQTDIGTKGKRDSGGN